MKSPSLLFTSATLLTCYLSRENEGQERKKRHFFSSYQEWFLKKSTIKENSLSQTLFQLKCKI